MDSRKRTEKPEPEGPDLAAQKRGKRKGHSKITTGMRIAVALGIVMAFVLLIAIRDDIEATVIFSAAAFPVTFLGAVATVILSKKNNYIEQISGYFCMFFFTFGGVFFILGIVCLALKSVMPETSADIASEISEPAAAVSVAANDREFHRMQFFFEKDMTFKNLVYYTYGEEIPEDEWGPVLENFVFDELRKGEFPSRYMADPDRLNTGAYAELTARANNYHGSYEKIKDDDIDAKDKYHFLEISVNAREAANEEYVTVSNSWSWLWGSEEMRDWMDRCAATETDEEEKQQFVEQARDYNRDILHAGWNILEIGMALTEGLDKRAMGKMAEAYRWERDHFPEEGTDYDAIIRVFEN